MSPKANLEAEARLTEKARGHVAGAFGEVGVRGDDAGRARACHLLAEGTHTSPPERRSSSVTSNPLAFFRNPLEPPAPLPEIREAGPRRRPAARDPRQEDEATGSESARLRRSPTFSPLGDAARKVTRRNVAGFLLRAQRVNPDLRPPLSEPALWSLDSGGDRESVPGRTAGLPAHGNPPGDRGPPRLTSAPDRLRLFPAARGRLGRPRRPPRSLRLFPPAARSRCPGNARRRDGSAGCGRPLCPVVETESRCEGER